MTNLKVSPIICFVTSHGSYIWWHFPHRFPKRLLSNLKSHNFKSLNFLISCFDGKLTSKEFQLVFFVLECMSSFWSLFLLKPLVLWESKGEYIKWIWFWLLQQMFVRRVVLERNHWKSFDSNFCCWKFVEISRIL